LENIELTRDVLQKQVQYLRLIHLEQFFALHDHLPTKTKGKNDELMKTIFFSSYKRTQVQENGVVNGRKRMKTAENGYRLR
jgi:hypothetical protein